MKLTNLQNTLHKHQQQIAPLLGFDLNKVKTITIDNSASNSDFKNFDVANVKAYSNYCQQLLEKENAICAIGGYLEERVIYQHHAQFGDSSRNIHLGVDVFMAAETKVYAPLPATIHSYDNNAQAGDYGPTLILKHEVEGLEFYTLYGHLSIKDLEGWAVEKTYNAGDLIGHFGNSSENGAWPPHLHFQLIMDMLDYEGDFPGVCSKQDLDYYKVLCPNPNLLLKMTDL